jgi:hypothetical protein
LSRLLANVELAEKNVKKLPHKENVHDDCDDFVAEKQATTFRKFFIDKLAKIRAEIAKNLQLSLHRLPAVPPACAVTTILDSLDTVTLYDAAHLIGTLAPNRSSL